jgi:hypothetical protein
MIARNVMVSGRDATKVAGEVVEQLRGDGLRLAVVFADWRLDPAVFVAALQRGLGNVPVVGCTTTGVLGAPANSSELAAGALGFYGDWLRVGIGVASELSKSALARSRDAIGHAAEMLGTRVSAFDPARHVAFTLVDGTSGHEEAFCIGSAASAPHIRVVGGSASCELAKHAAYVWANGEALADAGVVVVLETDRRFEAITSQHLIPTDVKTVVTAAVGRVIDELDGVPAARRMRELLAELGPEVGELDELRPTGVSFARFVDGVPYVRSLTRIEGDKIHVASAVEPGHVLRLMRPGDLIARTREDLDAVAARIGSIEALLAFSCLGRHWEAAARDMVAALADVYAAYPTTGFQSFGEQTGMLLVNHTLTALAIGGPR